jgi:hypothetical protein
VSERPTDTLSKLDVFTSSGKTAKAIVKTSIPVAKEPLLSSDKLKDLWSKVTLKGTSDSLSLLFKLKKSANSYYIESPADIAVCDSSGNAALDSYATECLKNSGPFVWKNLEKRVVEDSGAYLAIFDTRQKTVDIITAPTVDFGQYMADLQRQIKRAWFPPQG